MQRTSLNRNWYFHLGELKDFRKNKPDFSGWRVLDLPHDWSIEGKRAPQNPSGASNGYFPMGVGWYYQVIDAPEAWRGKKIMVEFEGVYMNAEVRLNEHYLGRHPYGYTTFVHDLTPYLKYGETNHLSVFVDNSGQLNSRWYSGSGIYRPVWLIVAEPVHIAHWGVSVITPEVTSQHATVRARTQVENETGSAQEVILRSRIFSPEGSPVLEQETPQTLQPGQSFEFEQSFEISMPQLWSTDSPALYRLESQALTGGSVMDTSETVFGIRSIVLSADKGFLLNWQPVLMKGGCVHHDNGVLGSASYPRSEERKIELLKASGFNAVRCAHNPPAPAFLDACDRLGMLVIDETFDCWREGKNHFDYHIAFDDWWQRDTASMVLRDRNHPSVVVWSIGNEVMERDGRSNGAEVARMQAVYVRQFDPTRPVTSAICGVWDTARTWEDTDVVFATLDIGGYNYQWRQYEPDHARHSQRVMFGTESFPLEALENWQAVEDNPYVVGDFVWTSMDYIGESGIGRQHYETENVNFLGDYPWHQAFCGDIDLAGFKRPQSYFRDTVWNPDSPPYIAVHYPVPEGKTPQVTQWGWPDVDANWTWPGHEGQTFQVDVYSAAEQVELFLNGRSLGVKTAGQANRMTATFQVPYEPGLLKASAYHSGQPAGEYFLPTAGAPAAIRLTPDCGSMPPDPWSLCYVIVEVVDNEGRLNPQASHLITFSIEGPGEIAAVGSGNPTSTEMYQGSQRSAYRGRCIVVVKSNGHPGQIRLRVQADGLTGHEVVIPVG